MVGNCLRRHDTREGVLAPSFISPGYDRPFDPMPVSPSLPNSFEFGNLIFAVKKLHNYFLEKLFSSKLIILSAIAKIKSKITLRGNMASRHGLDAEILHASLNNEFYLVYQIKSKDKAILLIVPNKNPLSKPFTWKFQCKKPCAPSIRRITHKSGTETCCGG